MSQGYKILVEKLEGKRPHWIPKHIYVDNIGMNHDSVKCAQFKVNRIMNLSVAQKARNFLASGATAGFSRRMLPPASWSW